MQEIATTPVPEDKLLTTHYIKIYPDRYQLIIYKTPYSNVYTEREKKLSGRVWQQTENDRLDSIDDSIRQTKTRLSDIVICNNFDTFITFTLNCSACLPKCYNKPCSCDKKTCKRFDVTYTKRTQETWLNNQIKKYGRFPYVQVMEFHKNKGVHFHSLFKNYKGKFKFYKLDVDKRPLYNLVGYKKGFSTAKEIYDISGTSRYIRKYIMKEMPLFRGKKRYWSSQGLLRPVITQDYKLMSEIAFHPASTEWNPLDKPTIRENETIKMRYGNVESVFTLMLEDDEKYQESLNNLKSLT